jgi:predicted ATPase
MDSIHIQGYKSIRDATIELKPINILIGGNGSGKSNFLSFFEFFEYLNQRRLQYYVALTGLDKFLFKGRKITSSISVKIEFAKDSNKEYFNYYQFELKAGNEYFIFTKEYSGYRDEYNKRGDFTGANLASLGPEASITIGNNSYLSEYLTRIKKYHFHDTGRDSPFNKEYNVQNDSYYLYKDGGNIAAYLFDIKSKHPLIYKRIISITQSIAPYFLDFYLEPKETNVIRLQWRDKYSETIYGATDLSDGTIRFIALTVLFMQPKLPATIIIDEPELGLHPFAIAKLAGLIKSVAAKDTQVIVATQSVELMSHFQPEDVMTVDQIEGESKFNRLNSDELSSWLETYSLGDLWKQNIIGKAQP